MLSLASLFSLLCLPVVLLLYDHLCMNEEVVAAVAATIMILKATVVIVPIAAK